jgi:hypothetical protein
MSQRMPKSLWLVTLLIAVVLGMIPGMALPQNTLTTAIPLLFGWLILPFVPFATGVDPTHVPEWLKWLTFLYYPLAMLVMAACASWTVRSTGRRRQALLIVGVVASISTLVCIPVSMMAPSLNTNGIYNPVFVEPIQSILPVWLNMLFSAGLGWCLGCLISRPTRGSAS